MEEVHKPINVREYFSCLISHDNCLIEQDGHLYKPSDFIKMLEQHQNINLDTHCFYECCEGFLKSYHYSAKLGWSESSDSEKQCIGVVYW